MAGISLNSPISRKRKITRVQIEAMERRLFLSATLTTLANFTLATNGGGIVGSVTADASGNLYGVAETGGPGGHGTIFEIPVNTHNINVLASFDGTNGSTPNGAPILDSSGNLYGVILGGGTNNCGAVYELPSGSHSVSILASFPLSNPGFNDPGDQQSPSSSLYRDSAGDLFGTTRDANSVGEVYELPAGSSTLQFLDTIALGNPALMGDPTTGTLGSLVADPAGNLFGTTGGAGNGTLDGSVFEIPVGSTTLKQIAAFSGPDGNFPNAEVILDSAGDLFGTTLTGGLYGFGTVFEIPAGTSTIQNLASFNVTDGDGPQGELIRDAAGNLFGTTSGEGAHGGDNGTIFRVDGTTHALTDLYDFNTTDGQTPRCALIADSTGALYGTTAFGGTNGVGTVFKLTNAGFVLPGQIHNQLVFTQQPTTAVIGQLLAPTVVVSEEDTNNTIVTTGTGSVTLSLSGTGGTLGGTLTEPLVNGVATFSDLTFSAAGTFTLNASAGSDTPAVSTGILVAMAPPHLVFTQSPTDTIAGHFLAPAVIVSEEDQNGSVLTTDSSMVTLTISGDSSGSELGGTVTEPLVNGVATFSNLTIDTAGNYTLLADDIPAVAGVSAAFNITALPVSDAMVAISQPKLPTTAVAGQPFAGKVVVQLNNPTVTALSGVTTVGIYTSTDGRVDANSILVTSISPHLKLLPNHSVKVTVPIKSLPLGLNNTYTLLVQVTDAQGKFVSASTGSTVTVAAPSIAFAEQITQTTLLPADATGGKSKATAKLKITNNGNITSKGTSNISLFFSTDGLAGDGTLIRSVNMPIVLKPRANRVFTVALLSLPAVSDGSYTLVAQVTDPNNDTTQADSSEPFALAAPFVALVPSEGTINTLHNGSAVVNFFVSNQGNIPPNGLSTIKFFDSTDGSIPNTTAIYSKSQPLPVTPGKMRTINIHLTAAQRGQLSPGQILVIQIIDPLGNSQTTQVQVS